MKRTFYVIAQFFLYLFLDFVGSLFYQPFNIRTALTGTPAAPRTYVWDGIILMAIAYLLVILLAAIRRKLDSTAPWATFALLLAGLAGFVLKFGFLTQNW